MTKCFEAYRHPAGLKNRFEESQAVGVELASIKTIALKKPKRNTTIFNSNFSQELICPSTSF